MAKRLTELSAARLRPKPGKRLVRYDGLVPGLQLRVTPRGVRSWSLHYRVGGRLRRLTIGRYPEVSLAEARKRARAALEKADQGIDPAGERRGPQRGPARERTVAEAVESYLVLHVRRNQLRRGVDMERMLRGAVLPHWGSRPIASITHADALDLVDEIALRAPVMSNRVAAQIKRLFVWAVERKIIDASPVAGMKPPTREQARERVLADDELGAIWRACDPLGWPHGPIIRLLVLTGARRSEVCGMAWSEVDSDGAMWVKPGSRVKSAREHRLPLSAAAVELLQGLPIVGGSELVFPSRSGGPVTALSDAKARLDRLADVEGWRLHDLRRTVATGLQRLGVRLEVTEAILGHTAGSRAGVVGIYQRHEFLPEQRAALERWAAHVARLAEGGDSKVVALRR